MLLAHKQARMSQPEDGLCHCGCGEKTRIAKLTNRKILTPDAVREIRDAPGGLQALADRFGVAVGTVQGVRSRQRWIDVA